MKMNNKRIMSIMLVVMLTLSGLLAIAPASSAKPKGNVSKEKLQIENVEWDKEAQEFVIEMSLKFGLATAGERAGFVVSTIMTIYTGESIYVIEPKGDIVRKVARAEKDATNMVSIEPQHIQWDRDGGTVIEIICVTFKFVLSNPGNEDSGGITQIDPPCLELDVGPPDTD